MMQRNIVPGFGRGGFVVRQIATHRLKSMAQELMCVNINRKNVNPTVNRVLRLSNKC
jgi:hypothetical protein